MFLDGEHATSVAAESASPEAVAAPGAAAASSSGAPAETNVSRVVVTLTPEVTQAIQTLVDAEVSAAVSNATRDLDELETKLEKKIDDATADILRHLEPMITAIVEKSAPGPVLVKPVANAPAAPQELEAGDPVKVWADPEHKTFRLGEIVAVHDVAHAFDVKLDDATVSKIGADGLEYDDRK